MVLFLDFDGVLHPDVTGRELFSQLPHLWDILRACPDIRVVFSTSWREQFPFDELVDMATSNGGEDLADRFIGITPVLQKCEPGQEHSRERECLAWIAENEGELPIDQQPLRWLALDDSGVWFSVSCRNLYVVDNRTGLVAEDVQSVVARLTQK